MHGTTLANGRMIVPVWFASSKGDRTAHRPSVMSTLYSDDGENWHTGEIIFPDESVKNASEATLSECNGKVILNVRHEGETSFRAIYESPDGISDWSGPVFDYGLRCPICNAGMCGRDDEVFFANCDCLRQNYNDIFTLSGQAAMPKINTRKNLSVYRSTDGCKSWDKLFVVDENGGYCDIAASDGKIFVAAETGRKPELDDTWHFTELTLNIYEERN